jgi:hypothetical protein
MSRKLYSQGNEPESVVPYRVSLPKILGISPRQDAIDTFIDGNATFILRYAKENGLMPPFGGIGYLSRGLVRRCMRKADFYERFLAHMCSLNDEVSGEIKVNDYEEVGSTDLEIDFP